MRGAASARTGSSRMIVSLPRPAVLGLVPPRPGRAWNGGKRPVAVLKIARFWPHARRRSGQHGLASVDDSLGLDAFGSETSPMPAKTARLRSVAPAIPKSIAALPPRAIWIAAGIIVVLGAIGVGAYEYRQHPLPWRSSTGSVTFDTVPSGLEVFVGQKSVGRSPLTVALAPGTYDVRLGAGAQARTINVAVTAGTTVVQHYEMAPQPAAPLEGALRIQTDPSSLPVLLDGKDRGVSPLTIEKISPGDHDIVVRAEQGPLKRVVRVAGGETTSVFISSAAPKPEAGTIMAGWLAVSARIPLQVKENGHLIGSTDMDKLLLASGDHDLELSNDALGFRAKRRVKIAAGKTTTSSVDVPNGTLSVNALPWADVFVDGKHLGQTPIGNVVLPIGTHEVLFHHPDLGDRKETVSVTALSPARLGVDLRK